MTSLNTPTLTPAQLADYRRRAHAQIASGTSKENTTLDTHILD